MQVVAGPRELLENGRSITGCAAMDITDSVRSSLPEAFGTGDVRNYAVSLSGLKTTLDTCTEAGASYFVSWSCVPSRCSVSCSMLCFVLLS